MQRGVLNAVALSLGLVCSLRPSSDQLTARRPHQRLCMPQNVITVIVLISSGMYGWYVWFLTSQPWFTGGNGSSYQVPSPHVEDGTQHVLCCVICMIHFTPIKSFLQVLPMLMLACVMSLSSDSCYIILSLLKIQVIATRPPYAYTAGNTKHTPSRCMLLCRMTL